MNGTPEDRVKAEPDVEEEIPRFVASSSGIPASVERTRQLKHVSDVIALQVAHIQLISFYQEMYVSSLFGIDFRNVMIYGRIIPGTVKHENNTQIYKLDDGSGVVEVFYAHGLKRDLGKILKLVIE